MKSIKKNIKKLAAKEKVVKKQMRSTKENQKKIAKAALEVIKSFDIGDNEKTVAVKSIIESMSKKEQDEVKELITQKILSAVLTELKESFSSKSEILKDKLEAGIK